MCISIRHFSSSTRCFKYATASIVLAFVFYAVGFFTLAWASVYTFDKLTFIETSMFYGLWQSCLCLGRSLVEKCWCERRDGNSVWMTLLQAAITISLVGFFISGCISTHQLFSKRTKNWKRVNIFIQIIAGVLGIFGVTVYGINTRNEFDWICYSYELKQIYKDIRCFMGFSYYLCCASFILNLFVSVPLFIFDERIPERVKQKPQVRTNGRAERKTDTDKKRTVISTVA